MRLDIISIFPDYLAPLELSLVGRARARQLIDVRVHDLRDYAHDRHRTVDDVPYGGGPGMVMRPEPWGEALDSILPDHQAPLVIIPTPSGRPFTQHLAQQWSLRPGMVFACGRYEGIDARVAQEYAGRAEVLPVSLGDYVLAGGEVAALAMIEAVVRLLPGVLGNDESVQDDSFAPGAMESLLEGPVYTRPPEWRGHAVPDVLLSGDHGRIATWRRDQAIERTRVMRPEL
ncbi:MAG: tRNA (guanosine(37)-N1)-methyltransferase TrmD [Candidatus Nanopelagicales bacterium]|jgi:tRNA (guanine37-N1)-methyltransferase|nr:tRNA (guanosine(37)-N1)-methyltransferase TrmD [Candidatus Nanopelagicales bacterium]MDP4715032.1 tRNA (guanosine(37)-N1)-methyltransferase TrmD [Candidatus Nanopelagicales bacterium]MDP4905849.1 tRNA (guanosine(37)-N1)-methyltransferase TrmD [Candidatus Nanopelagicales bacterium]MDP4975363.1 tRNA (guanosine(37)-N1)-methyltransferase TrmD [Candidatus Nanopelagicales bacterium]MDP5095702.1 tRNA (guanosine(37)-N1)-methyltransferase TrmD [Candidatus Nanopelagicales bacterium]